MKLPKPLGVRALMLCCCAVVAQSAVAYDAEDDAGNSPAYDAWVDGDDGGAGFQAWSFNAEPDGNTTFTRAAASAASVGGNATHMDAGGRCFVQTCAKTSLGLAEATAARKFDVTLADGMKFSFVGQRIHGSGTDTESEIHILDGAGTPIAYVLVGSLGWRCIAGPTVITAGMSAATPVRVLIATDATAQTFDIEFRQLDGPGLFSNGGIAFDSLAGNAAELRFVTRQFDPGESHLLFNKLIVDPAGTLPVETSEFVVD